MMSASIRKAVGELRRLTPSWGLYELAESGDSRTNQRDGP